MKKGLIYCLLIGLISTLFSFSQVKAASLFFVSDAVSSHLTSASSDHEIGFTAPTGVNGPSDTINISLAGFNFSAITPSDVALSHGPLTGSETVETIAAAPGVGQWGMTISGITMTLTPPTNAGVGEVGAGQIIRIKVGLSAGGTHQMINPASAGGYVGNIDGGFGDTGTFGLAVVTNSQVLVTAENQGSSTGGHGQPTGDTVPPVIVNVIATSTSPTSAMIQWLTNEGSTSVVNYGMTNSYGSGTISDSGLVYQHSINLTDLTPCTTYQFQVLSADAYSNQSVSSGYSFKTTCDTVPPVISNVRAEQIVDTQATILWSTNEPATTRVEYGVGQTYASSSDSSGYVTLHSLPISGLIPNTVYNYRVISTDISGNTATSDGWVFTTTHDITLPTNVMLTATAGDKLVVLQWTAPLEPDAAGVRIVRRTDRYPLGPGDGDTVYAGTLTAITDSGLQNGTTYYYGAYAYDVNGNYSSGALASATPQVGIIPPVIPPVTPTSTPPVIPPVTPPVIPPVTPTSTPPVIPGEPTPGSTITFEFFGANGTLPLSVDDHGVIGTRGNAGITVHVPVQSMNGTPRYVVVIVGQFIIQLQLDSTRKYYEGTFSISPNVGVTVKGQALFIDGRVAQQSYFFYSYSNGVVVQSPLFGTGYIPVPGAQIRLYREELGSWILWNGSPFGESNPQTTSENGSYLYEVPAGRYYAEVTKDGYESFKTQPVTVTRNIFNERIELVYIPKSLRELLQNSTSTGLIGTVGVIAKSIGDEITYQLKKLRNILSLPGVQDVNTQIIVPSALVISAFNAVSAASLFQLVTYLQYLFTQPFLLLWRRKRERYGIVYNSLTKRPIDLCIVRLLHAETGLVMRTCVTDQHGRYVFSVKPGEYRIDILKPRFEFPSEFMTGKKTDQEYLDLYDGGIVRIHEDGHIALNVPIDPIVKTQTSRRVHVRSYLRKAQHGIASISIVVSIFGLIITPTVPMALAVVSQFIIYSLFKRLMVPNEPKRWGFVYDARTLRPVSSAIVRLYDQKYGRLLDTQPTNTKGQYGFLVGKNVYSITVEANGYEPSRLERIDLTKKDDSAIDAVVRLNKISKDKGKKWKFVK